MATDNIQEYGIEIGFEAALKKMNKLRVTQQKMNKIQESSLLTQINLQKRLNSLKTAGAKMGSGVVGSVTKVASSTQQAPRQPRSTVSDADRAMKAAQTEAIQMDRKRDAILASAAGLDKQARASLKQQLSTARTTADMQRMAKIFITNTKQLQKQNFLMERMRNSSKQFSGNMVSAFAVAAGVRGVVRIGQDFEAVNNTMLAVSSGAEEAGENFQFVRNEAFRLGLGLKESAKGFAKMKAAQGEMKDADMESLFIGVSEASTVLGLSVEEQSRSINAISQMLSKGKISAEELRLQLGEVMPTAIQDMARAAQEAGAIDKSLKINDAVAAMLDLQQEGKLISSEILPFFGKQLSKTFGSGLDKALDSNRVAMNRFMMTIQEGSDTFFKSGFSEGLTELFNNMAELIRDNQVLWKSLGKILGSVLKGIAKAVKVINPVMQAFGKTLEVITDILKDFSGLVVAAFAVVPIMRFLGVAGKLSTLIPMFSTLTVGTNTFTAAIGFLNKSLKGLIATFLRVLLPAAVVLGVLEEISEIISPTEGKRSLATETAAGGKFSATRVFGDNAFTRFLERPISDYANPTGMQFNRGGLGSYTNGNNTIKLDATLNIDGEAVANKVITTNTADQWADRKIQMYQ